MKKVNSPRLLHHEQTFIRDCWLETFDQEGKPLEDHYVVVIRTLKFRPDGTFLSEKHVRIPEKQFEEIVGLYGEAE